MGFCICGRVVTFLSCRLYIAFLICGLQEEQRGIQINKETNTLLENSGEVNSS